MNAPVAIAPSSCDLVETQLAVPGIHCAGCIAKIERELARLDTVETARVNFSAKRVIVRHARELSEAALVDALRRIGFEAQSLVAADPSLRDEREMKTLMRALAVAGFGMMNIMLLSVSVWAGAGGATRELFHWLSAIIAVPVISYAGRPFFSSAWKALKFRRTNMDVPIAVGIGLTVGLSLYETITWGQHAYFESAVMLLFFLLAGRALDSAMRARTRAGIGALLSKMGRSAGIVQPDGSICRLPAEDIEPDMIMLVAAGETLAADGIIESGESMIDNAMLTGESAPEKVDEGKLTLAGAINLLAPIRVRVTAAAGDTALAEMARLMDGACQSRSRYIRIADRAARLYAPFVHSLALLAFVGWMAAGAGWYHSLVVAIAVLIITCPCAMGLAVPAAQVVASGVLGRRGLLVKDGSALERLAQADMVLFDKTGTLTLGEPQPDLSGLPDEALPVVLALAQASRHPLSRAIVASLADRGIIPATIERMCEQAGHGISGIFAGEEAALERSIGPADGLTCRVRLGTRCWTVRFTDHLRPDARKTVAGLRALGVEACILSGDNAEAVAAVGHVLGIEGEGGASPVRKMAVIEALKGKGHRPLMVGDGLNDGPALAAAHVSIAPGTASDISKQAADAVFIGQRLNPILLGLYMARRTMAVVRQNFGLAVIYNLCAIPLALAGLVTPLIAAVAMSLSSLLVIGNSLRLAKAAR